MYVRECDKMKSGLARTVPKLREIHIIQDSWTTLNIAPAKIMQVCKNLWYYAQIEELIMIF